MKKEVVIAIVFGIVLGLGVAFFLVSRIKEMDNNKMAALQPSPSIEAQPSVSAANNEDQSLIVSSPNNNAVVNANSISISGKTQKQTLLVVQSSSKDTVIKQDQDNFNFTVSLTKGENIITITAYPQDKQLRTQQKTLHIYNIDEQ